MACEHRARGDRGGCDLGQRTGTKLFADAKSLGISSTEIEEDTGSAYEAILDAIVHHDPGLPD
jgi:hypothetical protein